MERSSQTDVPICRLASSLRGFVASWLGVIVSLPLHALIVCVGLTLSCTAISIAPSCPNELRVDESAPLLANELTPGAIAEYSWTVDPPSVGTVRDPKSPNTVFTAKAEGDARIELTANDGLFQVTSFCTTRVAGVSNTNANDNTTDNTNTNTNANANDNRPEIPDRPGGIRKARPASPGRDPTEPRP